MGRNNFMSHSNFVGATSGIPIGHISRNFGKKKYLSFPQILQFVNGDF